MVLGAEDAKKNKQIQISLSCPANTIGLVGYCLVAKLVYRPAGSFWLFMAQKLSYSLYAEPGSGGLKVYDKQVPLPRNAGSRHSGRAGEFRRLLMLTGCQLPHAEGKQKHEAILVLSRETLCIEFPTSSHRQRATLLALPPFTFLGKQRGAYLQRRSGHVFHFG